MAEIPTMKSLLVFYDEQRNLTTELEGVPVPKSELKPNDVLIKVSVAGSNPKDWKHPLPEYFNNKLNMGDDCVGTIEALGSDVRSFKIGERVAGFHMMDTPNGTYAEYAICPAQTVFRIPDSMSDEEAATFPLAIYTAAVGLYRNLEIPAAWNRSDDHAPRRGKAALIVNGGASAVGAFAIKLAKLNPSISPIIATAGSSTDYVRSLGVDAIVNYHSPNAAEDIRKAAGGVPIKYAIDSSNTDQSVKYITEVLSKDGRYTSTTPVKAYHVTKTDGSQEKMLQDAGVWYEQIWVADVHGTGPSGKVSPGGYEFGAIMSKIIEDAIFAGKLKGHPYEVVQGGLDGLYDALVELRDRKRGGNAKFVTRIADTPSLKGKQ